MSMHFIKEIKQSGFGYICKNYEDADSENERPYYTYESAVRIL